MKNHIILIITAIVISVLLPNCASIVSRSNYPVAINSTPSGAHVLVLDKHGYAIYDGPTPAYLTLEAGAGFFTPNRFQLRFDMDGYDDAVMSLNTTLDPWYFGNILFGGLIGMLIVDPITGAMWKLDQRYVNVNLVPDSQQAINVIDIKDIPEEYKEHLIRVK